MSDDIFGFLARVADNTVRLSRMESFARPLKTAIKEHEFQKDGMKFIHAGDADHSDMVHSGRHTMIYRLVGTDKLYRVMVEPIPETHR